MSNRLLEFMGDGVFQALTGDVTLYLGAPRVQVFTPDAPSHDVVLPDTAVLRLGGPHFYIINLSDTHLLSVKSHNDEDVFQVDPEEGIVLGAFKNSGTKRWFGKVLSLVGTAIGEVTP